MSQDGSRTQRVLQVAAVGAAALFVVIMYVNSAGLAAGHDLLWALRAGSWEVAHRAVLTRELWSWTANGATWVNHEWLWEVLVWALYHADGWYGIEVCVGCAAVAAYLTLAAACRAGGTGRGWAPFTAGMGVVLGLPFWTTRAQTADYALFCALLWLLARARRADWPWALLLAALWANLHGGGSVLVAAVPLAAGVFDLAGGARDRGRSRLLLGAAGFAGTLLNPFGIGLWAYTVGKVLGGGAYALERVHVAEWLPPDTANPYILGVFLLALVVFVLAARRRAWAGPDLALACCFFAAALFGTRYLPYLGFWTAYTLRPQGGPFLRPALAGLVLGIALALVPVLFLRHPRSLIPAGSPAAQYLAAARTDLAVSAAVGQPCWNGYVLGDYVLWLGGRPSIDSRADPYVPSGVFATSVAVSQGKRVPPASCLVLAKPEVERTEELLLKLKGWTEQRTADARVFLAPGVAGRVRRAALPN